jgi:hypothetical protein
MQLLRKCRMMYDGLPCCASSLIHELVRGSGARPKTASRVLSTIAAASPIRAGGRVAGEDGREGRHGRSGGEGEGELAERVHGILR